MICSFPCRFRIEASKSSISAVAENPNCDDMRHVRLLTLFSTVIFSLLEKGAYSLINGYDSQRSRTDFEIHISVQRCLRECPLVAEAVKLPNAGEGTIRRIFTLNMHFDNLIFFSLSRSTSCWVIKFSNSFYFLAKTDSFCFNSITAPRTFVARHFYFPEMTRSDEYFIRSNTKKTLQNM